MAERIDVLGNYSPGDGSTHIVRLARALRITDEHCERSPPGGCPVYHVGGETLILCQPENRGPRGITYVLHDHQIADVNCEQCLAEQGAITVAMTFGPLPQADKPGGVGQSETGITVEEIIKEAFEATRSQPLTRYRLALVALAASRALMRVAGRLLNRRT